MGQPCRLTRSIQWCSQLSLVLLAATVSAQEARFRFSFDSPDVIVAPLDGTARAIATVQLETHGLRRGEPGAQGWSLGVRASGACTIVDGTTLATAGAHVRNGGVRQNGFEITSLAQGGGVVSAVILSNAEGVTLEPSLSPHDILRIQLSARLRDDVCETCELNFRGDLRGSGQPVPLLITHDNESYDPEIENASIPVCPQPCFENREIPNWEARPVGIADGTARELRGGYELCGSSLGYGAESDNIYTLSNTVMGDFSMVARLDALENGGLGGVEARSFTGTSPEGDSERLRISVVQTPNGTLLQSSVRFNDGDKEDSFNTEPVRVELPIFLRVRREAGQLYTCFSNDGRSYVQHLIAPVRGGMATRAVRAGMVQSSLSRTARDRVLHTTAARFSAVDLQSNTDAYPPFIGRFELPQDPPPTVGLETILEIPGNNLEETEEVTVAGEKAEILERGPNRLLLRVPPFNTPVRGEIVVRTAGGVSSLPNGFFTTPGRSQFIRCDCDGNQRGELTDAIRMLGFQFLGLPPCEYPKSDQLLRFQLHHQRGNRNQKIMVRAQHQQLHRH
ncbi:MAG: hypothetical protein AAF517_19920 [Planctomycetota bacterium]